MRKIVLILCLAFVVVGFGWPTIILPYTKYTYKTEGQELSYTFQLNGKVKRELKIGDTKHEDTFKYKINFKENAIEIQITDKTKETLTIDSFFKLSVANFGGAVSVNATNNVAMGVSIGVGVLALLLVILAPSKRY